MSSTVQEKAMSPGGASSTTGAHTVQGAGKKVFLVQPSSSGRFTVVPAQPDQHETGFRLGEYLAVYWRTWLVILAPFILSPIILVAEEPLTIEAMKCAYVILLMASYWMTEALPLPITSMIPVVALPLLGLMSTKEVAINYLNATNYMFLGGLIMAIAVEHSGLHNRVALRIIMMVGVSQARLMLGFMLTTMFLSMWISNTATTAMMLPIVDAVAEAINAKDVPAGPAGPVVPGARVRRQMSSISQGAKLDNYKPPLAVGESMSPVGNGSTRGEEHSQSVDSIPPIKEKSQEAVNGSAGGHKSPEGGKTDEKGEKAVRMQEVENGKPATNDKDSPHASEEEDMFDYDEFDLPMNQRTFTSINQLTINPRSYQHYNTVGPWSHSPYNHQMTVTSIGSLNPANDPESMVAFLPNVRLNSMDRGAGQEIDMRSRFRRRNTMEREPMRERKNSRLEKISLLSKDVEEILSQPGEDVIAVTVDKDALNTKEEAERNFLLMGIAYAANIGGTGVITGSPPNLVVPDTLSKMFGPNTGLTFASWMAFAIPIMTINTILAWLWLQQVQKWELRGKATARTKLNILIAFATVGLSVVQLRKLGKKMGSGAAVWKVTSGKAQEDRAMKVITEKYYELGRMTLHEIQVFILFSILLILWFFQSPKFMTGWADLFILDTVRGSRVAVGAATPAILTVLFLFILPQTYDFPPFTRMTPGCLQNSPSLITWRLIETKMCWGVIFLLGGGFALAAASQNSGLSSLLVEQLEMLNLSALPQPILIGVVCLLTVSITNIASNTATANVLVPILSEMAITMCVNPIYLTLPAGIVCSYAFALPVATAPNAIVFGHSTLKTADMMKAGLVMNVICVFTIVLAINSYAIPLFALNTFPDWASVKLANASMCAA